MEKTKSLNPDVWRGDGPYYWRPVFSDYGDDYQVIKFPDGETARVEMQPTYLKELVDAANR